MVARKHKDSTNICQLMSRVYATISDERILTRSAISSPIVGEGELSPNRIHAS